MHAYMRRQLCYSLWLLLLSRKSLYSRIQLQLTPIAHPTEVRRRGRKGYFPSASKTPCTARQCTCTASKAIMYTFSTEERNGRREGGLGVEEGGA